MSRLVNDMLSLARADTGQTFELDPVPLQPLVEEVARRAHFLEKTAEWHVGELSVLNGVYVEGNKDYLRQMLFIFIENAFKYTPEGEVSLDVVLYKGQVGREFRIRGSAWIRMRFRLYSSVSIARISPEASRAGPVLAYPSPNGLLMSTRALSRLLPEEGRRHLYRLVPVVFAPPLE